MGDVFEVNVYPGAAIGPKSGESHGRFVEQVLKKEISLPKVSALTVRLRAEQPQLLRRDMDGRSALHLLEILIRVGATAFAMSLLIAHRWRWPLAILWMVQAVNYFGFIAFVHDLVHDAAFRRPWLNKMVALILCPLVLLRYSSFRRAHLLHHEHNQSRSDPKVGKVLVDRSSLASRIFSYLNERLYKSSSPTTQRIMVFFILLLASFPIMHASHEFSPFQRPRKALEVLEALILIAFWTAAAFLLGTKSAALILFVPLLFAYQLVAIVFLTHEHEWTISPQVTNRDEYELMIFNIRDITLGRVVDRLSFYFARYHVAHHLFPGLPFHRLKKAAAFVDRECAAYIQPVSKFDLDHMRSGMVDYCYGRVQKEIGGQKYDVMPGYGSL